MKFSIIVPSYNQANFLSKTLKSILMQKGEFNIECLVFDGGSTDNSIEILRETEEKVKAGFFNTKNKLLFCWIR